MHCLEDDLELLEDVPAELKRLCCKMRHLDFRVEKALSEVREKSSEFFNIRNALTQEERENRIARIHKSYHDIRKFSEDKIAIAEHLHLMLEKYQERMSSHLSEIKYLFDTPELNESIQSAINSQRSQRAIFSDYDSVSNDSSYAEDIKSPSVSRIHDHRHATIPSNAQQTIVGSTSVNENIVFKTAPSGNHPKQLQKRITQYFASLGEVPSTPNSTNEHYAGPPKKKIPNVNMTLPSVRLEQFQTARKSALSKGGVKTAGASLAESQKRILPNTTKISQPPEEAKSRRKSFIFPTRIIKETTKTSKSRIFSANATLPITVNEMAPTKDRIEHCESLFIGSQDHITDFDDTINSRNSYVDVLKYGRVSNQTPAFIKIFNKELFPEEYNGWIVRNGYSKQIPLEGQKITGNESTENDRDIYVLGANIYQNQNHSHDTATTVFYVNVEPKDETYFNTLLQHFIRLHVDPFICICSLSLYSLKIILNLVGAMKSDRNRLQYPNHSHDIAVLSACVELKNENWPLFQHFIHLIMDPFIYIRTLFLSPKKGLLSLLAGAMNPNRDRLQCKMMRIDFIGDTQKFIVWTKDHVHCDEFYEIYIDSDSNYDEELLDFLMTGALCASTIRVENYDLSKVIVDFAQKFMGLKSGNEYQVVESIQGNVKDRGIVEELKHNYAELVADEEQYEEDLVTRQVIRFINNDIEKKLTLSVENSNIFWSPLTIKIANL